jgi:hypothetical protein
MAAEIGWERRLLLYWLSHQTLLDRWEALAAKYLVSRLFPDREGSADNKRRDAMAMAAAPYLHSRPSAIDVKLSPAAAEPGPEGPPITVTFVMPGHDEND